MEKISFKNFRIAEVEILSRNELKKISGGDDFECPQGQIKTVVYEYEGIPVAYGCIIMSGAPGGNNGDPCPLYCEPVGGKIYCIGKSGNVAYYVPQNCNTLPEHVQGPGLHNACIHDVTGGFWC